MFSSLLHLLKINLSQSEKLMCRFIHFHNTRYQHLILSAKLPLTLDLINNRRLSLVLGSPSAPQHTTPPAALDFRVRLFFLFDSYDGGVGSTT